MKNIALQISYDGRGYSGWQIQNDVDSIQGRLTKAIYSLTGEKVQLIGSGRTDKGVHAIRQYANFFTNSQIQPERFSFALNANLPLNIRVNKSFLVSDDFNSRKDAISKTYKYLFENAKIPSPFLKGYALQVRADLDIKKMEIEGKKLIGTHDFTSFYKNDEKNPKNPIRTINSFEIIKSKEIENLYYIEINGNSFLHNMVRIIVGTLIDIGRGRIKIGIKDILEKNDRKFAGKTAIAEGLYLKEVFYDKKYIDF